MSSRAGALTAYCGHRSGQSPGETYQLKRICTACGRLPGSPFCQASSWILEVCSAAARRAMDLGEEYHLLPSHVSRGCGFGIFHWGC